MPPRYLMELSMRWIAASVALLLSGCGGLERQSYPVLEQDVLFYGLVTHVQPYRGEASESGWSRAGWGALSGGLIAGAIAGLADRDIDAYDAYSYVIKTSLGAIHTINSFALMREGECVAVYHPSSSGMHSLVKQSLDHCTN